MSIVANKINIIGGFTNNEAVCQLITELNPDMDEAFFVCNLSEVIRRYNLMKYLMPRVLQYYAIKCNSNEYIVRAMAAIGCNFECASQSELQQVLDLNVHTDRILFGHPIKPDTHIEYAAKNQIKKMTFDTEDELYKINKLYPTAELILRLRCDAKVCDFSLGKKFGCDPINDGPVLIKLAKTLGLKMIGISFHVGSGCGDVEVYDCAIKYAKDLFDYGNDIGYKFTFLDLGGGFYGYSIKNVKPQVNAINTALDKYFPHDAYSNLTIITEFGQYYVAACCTLVCNVLGRKLIYKNNGGGKDKCHDIECIQYFINDNIYKNFICAICGDIYYPSPQPLFKNDKAKIYPSTIYGCTIEEEDKLYENIELPEMKTGDWMIIDEMGAYTSSIETLYGGFPKNQIYPIIDEHYYTLLKKTLVYQNDDFNFFRL